MGYRPSVRSRWLDICKVLFRMFMDRVGVEVHKHAKKGKPISSHVDLTLGQQGFIIWLSGKVFLRDTAAGSEWTRYNHHAR